MRRCRRETAVCLKQVRRQGNAIGHAGCMFMCCRAVSAVISAVIPAWNAALQTTTYLKRHLDTCRGGWRGHRDSNAGVVSCREQKVQTRSQRLEVALPSQIKRCQPTFLVPSSILERLWCDGWCMPKEFRDQLQCGLRTKISPTTPRNILTMIKISASSVQLDHGRCQRHGRA
jgi:hypothetical protein